MIKKIRSLTDKHAIVAAVITIVLIDLLMFGLGQLLSLLPKTMPMKYLIEVIMVLVPVAFVVLFGFSRAFKEGKFLQGLFCCLPFILLQLFLLGIFFLENLGKPETTWNPWYMIIYGVISIVGIGIREECIYRATIQNVVAKKYANSVKGIWITAIVGAVIFGLSHISNLIYGMDPLAVISQVISATVAGLLFAAVYLRSGSLWALILIHTLTDVAGLAKSTFLHNVNDIENLNQLTISWISPIIWLGYIGLAIFLLRPSKCKQICENLCFADK